MTGFVAALQKKLRENQILQMGVLYHERREQNKNDRGQYLPEDHPVCHPAVSRKSVSAALQHSRLADCRKLSGKQRAGSRQLIGKSDLPDGRFYQRYRDGCRCCDCKVLWGEKPQKSAESHPHDRGLRPGGRCCADCDRYVPGTENSGADGNAVRCPAAVRRVFPHVFCGFSRLYHV